MYTDVIVGFNQTEFTVSEEVGEIQLCLVIIVPEPGMMFEIEFPVSVETQDGTAIGKFHRLYSNFHVEKMLAA